MKQYYFTFGSDRKFPYDRDDYVLVKADGLSKAVGAFRAIHPDVHQGVVNCASWYNETEWQNGVSQHYVGREPAEIITLTVE